jgi:hypothetical protein
VRAGRDAEQHALTKHHSPCKCERSRWLTSSRQHPDLHSKYARKQNIMQSSATVVFLLALVIVVTGWILSRLSLSPLPGNRAGNLERSKRRR